MTTDFDRIIDRRGTRAVKYISWRPSVLGLPADAPLPFPDEDYLPLWVADTEFAAPQPVLDAMRARLDHQVLGYTTLADDGYYEDLVGWLSRRHGWTVQKEDIFCACGLIHAMAKWLEYATAPGDKVLLMTPGYNAFRTAIRMSGRELVDVPMACQDGWYTVDEAALSAAAAHPKATAMLLCSPHNPSGRVWREEELRRMGEICFQNGVSVFSDEIHCDLVRKGQAHIPFAKVFPEETKLAVGISPSKTFNLAGNNFAHVIIRDPAVRQAWAFPAVDRMLNPLSVAATQAAYSQCDQWVDDLNAYLDENFAFAHAYLKKHLPQARFRIPEGTYLAWIDLSQLYRPEMGNLAAYIAQRAPVVVEPGTAFVGGQPQYIRVNVACPRSVLRQGLEGICAALSPDR